MKIKSSIATFLCLMMMVCAASFGFTQVTKNVAVIDSQKAFEKSNEGQKIISQLQAKDHEIQLELAKIDDQIQDLETRLNMQKFTLKDEAKQKIIFNLDKLRVERKRYEEDSVKEYRQLQFRLYNRLRSEVLPIIETVAREQGFAIVFDLSGSSVAYFDPVFDITAEVIKRYNASKAKQE
jgi:Skp family chaperone for outer membrane proteins